MKHYIKFYSVTIPVCPECKTPMNIKSPSGRVRCFNKNCTNTSIYIVEIIKE